MSSLSANFVPVRRLISNVSNALNAVITTTEDHGYEDGQWVRIIVPNSYGMDIFYVQTQIVILSNNSFTSDIDTRFQLPFVAPAFPPAFTDAQVVPISGVEDNLGVS